MLDGLRLKATEETRPSSTPKRSEAVEWLTAAEAARHLKVRPSTLLLLLLLLLWVQASQGARVQALRHEATVWRFPRPDLDTALFGNTPVNPGNAPKRYLRTVAEALGIALGGWHDFEPTLTTGLLPNGVSPTEVSKILGHGCADHPQPMNQL
jgi:hypothetical protein